jgi:tetratricopeptide (TPR) repeat protein
MSPTGFTPRNWRIWIASAALCALQGADAAPAPSITAGCAQPRTAEAFDAAFTEATVQRHSLEQLTCAAAMSAANAARMATDVDMQMLALDAQINLLESLQLKLDTQTYQGGDVFIDIKARWALGIRQGKVVSARLVKAAQSVPSIAGMRLAFDLVSVSSSLVEPERTYKVAADTIKPLADLLDKNPKLLDGVGEMLMGRLYFQLPETANGDLDKAVVHLKNAHEINRKSIVFQRWYAEALLALGRNDEARQVLAKMLPLKPDAIERQSFADELRAGEGLAQRAGDPTLTHQITAKRAALLQEFPQLQTRQTAAVSGHGGVDPLTGKSTD